MIPPWRDKLRGRLRRALGQLLADPPERPAPVSRLDDYPPPYPSGWYLVATSAEVARGRVHRAVCAGRELVVFRGQPSGRITVADAYCPHQGAHLGVGGQVVGEHIRCPFHHWQFDCDGAVARIPGLDRLPRVALRTFPACERYGVIWAYFDHQDPGAEAPYRFAEHPDIDDGSLVLRGEHVPQDVRMHLVEFAENSVDFQHFPAIHRRMLVPWTQVAIPFVTIEHEPSWDIDEDQPYIAYFDDRACVQVLERPLPWTRASARITFFGPGGVTWFRFQLPDVGAITLFHTHTPVAPLTQRVYFRWYATPTMPRALVSYVVGSWISNWQADIDIWENKVYRQKPMLSKADGPVMRMRRWYRQFYGPDPGTARPGE